MVLELLLGADKVLTTLSRPTGFSQLVLFLRKPCLCIFLQEFLKVRTLRSHYLCGSQNSFESHQSFQDLSISWKISFLKRKWSKETKANILLGFKTIVGSWQGSHNLFGLQCWTKNLMFCNQEKDDKLLLDFQKHLVVITVSGPNMVLTILVDFDSQLITSFPPI